MSIPGLEGIIASKRVPGVDASDGLGEYIADNVVSADTWPDTMLGTPDDLTAAVDQIPVKTLNVARGNAGLLFDGIDDKFTRGIPLISGPSFSSASVFRIDSFPTSEAPVWGQWFNNDSDIGLSISNGGNVIIHHNVVGTILSNTPLLIGRTYHIFIEYDSPNDILRVWINGEQETPLNLSTYAPIYNGNNFILGENGAGTHHFNGMHFFHKFWNKLIFKKEVVCQLYQTLLRQYGVFGYEYEESTFETIPTIHEYQESAGFNTPITVVEYQESTFNNSP